MKKRATVKRRQAVKRKKAARRARNQAENGSRPLSLDNPPKGFTMSVDDLAELIGSGRNQAYEAVRQGVYPSVRAGKKGAIKVLTLPTLRILRGEQPPGEPAHPAGAR